MSDRFYTSRVRDRSAIGAGAALDGYEYQLDVSILAALDLMLAKKLAGQITLEPANEEDLAADLVPDVPGRVQPTAVTDGYELVIQVKLRNADPWDLTAFRALLNHGKRRKPAKDLLKDAGKRLLLVTSADTRGELRGLSVQDFAHWPPTADFPTSLANMLPPASAGRVAIWGGLSERVVEQEIDKLLTGLLHVPEGRLVDCKDALRREAKLRMRGENPGVWARADLVATIRLHGGYLASAPELDTFVKPANWKALVERLRSRGGVVITGPSGTGKTTAALALCELQADAQPGLHLTSVSGSPSDARPLAGVGPTLFYIEDPWGQNSLLAGSEAWSEQLPRMLRQAGGARQYVVTTRSDMLQSARGDGGLASWMVELDAEQYEDGQLAAIYDKRMAALPPPLQPAALHFRGVALDQLKTPLEVDVLFGGFADGPKDGEKEDAFFRRVIGLAHRDAIAATVASKLKASDPIGWSAVLWVLLSAWTKVERLQLIAVQAAMRRLDPHYRDGLERLVNTLVAARHLRQPVTAVSYAHPSVQEGIQFHVAQEPGRTDGIVETLLSGLVALDSRWQDWGLETVARILALPRGDGDAMVVPASVQAAVDDWLDRTLVSEVTDFAKALELASEAGSSASVPSELARWLLKGVRRGGNMFLDDWQPPAFDDAWYSRVAADPRSLPIAARFIREILPEERDSYGRHFPERLDRVAAGLTPAFADAALRIVHGGFGTNVEMIASGATRDLAAAEPAFEAALDAVAAVRRDHVERWLPHWRRIQNGEFDYSEEEHFQLSHEDDSWSAGSIVDIYVARLREVRGWEAVAAHPRSGELASAWSRAVARLSAKPSVSEARRMLEKAREGDVEDLAWRELRHNWPGRMASALEHRVLQNPSDNSLRGSLAECLVSVGPLILPPIFAALVARPADLVALLVDVHAAAATFGRKQKPAVVAAIAGLPAWARALYAALPTRANGAGRLRSGHADIVLASLDTGSSKVLAAVLSVLVASGARPSQLIERWFRSADDADDAAAAAQMAIDLGDTRLLRVVLQEGAGRARAAAMRALAPTAENPLPTEILGFHGDPSSYVRQALVDLLARAPHSQHKVTLLRLAADKWSSTDAFYDEDPARTIARQAIVALKDYMLDDVAGDTLVAIALETPDAAVRTTATAVAADVSTARVRWSLWKIGVEPVPKGVRVDALNALSLARSVEPDLVAQVTAQLLLGQPPVVAAAAMCLLARHGDPETVFVIVERVAQSGKRRALLLIAAALLNDLGRRDVAERLLQLLPAGHPAGRLLDLAKEERLPVTALDELGSVRVRKAVSDWLERRFYS